MVNLNREILTGRIVKSDESSFQMETYRPLIADQRQYEFPSDVANQIIKVEVKRDGTNWQIAKEVDINQISTPLASETDIRNYFDDTNPKYTLFRNCINLYTASPITAVPAGLHLWYNVYPHQWSTDDLASAIDISIDVTATDPGFPREFHECLLYMTTRMYKESKERPLPLIDQEQNIENMIQESLKAYRGANRSRAVNGQIPPDTGTSY